MRGAVGEGAGIPTARPRLAASNVTSSAAPTGIPALEECVLPSDIYSPMAKVPSPSVRPSARPRAGAGSTDAALEAARAASLRRATSQCGFVYSDALADAAAVPEVCDDWAEAVRAGGRAEGRDAPFATAGCRGVWFSADEACDLLLQHNHMV
jgi:hypothetical protein